MRFTFFLILVLSHIMLFAQITVTNSSYIFIDSTYVYAKTPINLEATSSHIYLRNKGELLQNDDTGIENTGLGSLSVYQTGNTNEYTFNYWCSPVGNNNVDNSLNNAYVANLLGDPDSAESIIDYVPATFTSNYEGSSNPLVISSRWIFTYNTEDGTNFGWNLVGDIEDISPGLGFTMKGTSGSNNSQLYEFRGKPNTGTISNVVMEDESILIGNPYPSGLDTRLFIHDTENVNAIDGTLYFWEQNLSVSSHYSKDYIGGYATYTISSDGELETFIPAPFNTYNADGSINSTGTESGSKIVTQYLSIGQGFMVKGKVGTSGVVKTKNSHRVYSNISETSDIFFKISDNRETVNASIIKTANNLSETSKSSEYMRFRLNVDFNDLYTRQLVHNFNDNATVGFDYGMESKNINEISNDVYWIQNDESYLALASVFDEELTIPIVVNLESSSELNFRLLDVENFDSEQNIYLYDKEANVSYNLTSQNCFLNLEIGNYTNRFEIRFKNEYVAFKEIVDDFNLVAFFNNGKINISNKNAVIINKIVLYSINGMNVLNSDLNTQEKLIKISASQLSAGIYFLKCFTDTSVEDFKIIVK